MALIEFKCESCGHVFEKLLGVNDSRDNIICEKCKEPARQNFSGKCYGIKSGGGGCSGNCKTCSGCK